MAQVVAMGVVSAAVAAAPTASLSVFASLVEYTLKATAAAIGTLRSYAPELTSNPIVKSELVALDVEAKLATVQALIMNIAKSRPSTSKPGQQEEPDPSDVIRVCVENVSESVTQLSKTLDAIKAEIALHDTRWFSSWRSPNTAELLANLRAQMLVLDKRVDLLLKCKDFVA